MDLKRASHLFFAATMIAIGFIGLISGDFAPIWRPVPEIVPGRELLAYLCTFITLAAGAGLLAKRTAAPAALVLAFYLVIWTILFKIPFIIRMPLVEVSYQTNGENAVLVAGAWILYAWSASDCGRWNVHLLSGELGIRIARLLYGLALIAFGFSHFAYLNMTAPLVPQWLGAPVFWAYLTGCLYLATGIAVVTGIGARAGSVVSAIQIALITLLVWGPTVVTGDLTPMHWQETVFSWAMTAGAVVVAASFEGRPWFGRLRTERADQVIAG